MRYNKGHLSFKRGLRPFMAPILVLFRIFIDFFLISLQNTEFHYDISMDISLHLAWTLITPHSPCLAALIPPSCTHPDLLCHMNVCAFNVDSVYERKDRFV